MKKNIIKSLLSLILSVSMLVTGLGLTVHASVSEELGGQTEAGVSTEIPAPIKGKPQGEQADGLQDPEAGEIEEAGLSGLSTGPEVSGGQFGRLGLREVVSQDRLTDLVATVKQDGNLIDTGATITSTKPIRVDFSFGVPVKGDDPSPTNPIQHGDTVTFEISSAFELTSFNVIELKKDGETVGHAAFTTDPNTNMVTATVTFDGKEQIFTDNSYSKVKVSFGGEFTYDSSGASGNPGGHTVTILEKEYTVNVPDAPIVYDVTKSGEANLKDQSIEWTVNISATQNGQSLDLAGYKFSDNLKDVGNYIKNSFKVATSEPTPEWNETTKELSYVLLPNSISPQTITFKTAIPDDMYYATGQQTIGNTAKLLDSTSLPITEGAGSATFTPEWITKTGATNDDVNVVEYHPENRTITWTITANQYAAKLYNVIITDVLPEGLELASATWQKWDGSAWTTPATTIVPDANGQYSIGDIDSMILLTIVSKVPDESYTTSATTYTNSANIKWNNGPDNGLGTGGVPVGIGYNAIEKKGVADTSNQKITWTVTVDTKQQNIPNLKVYDLLVYGKSIDLKAVTGIPEGIKLEDLTPQYGQKNVKNSFVSVSPTSMSITVIPIMSGDDQVADLLEITGLSTTDPNTFTFESLVVDPDIFAGNTTYTVNNTATLFSSTSKLNAATGSVSYKNDILLKQMLKREAMADPASGANNTTSTATEGFDYVDKSVIFRLVVNADGIDLTGAENAAGQTLGKATLTDTLPDGWEFVDIVSDSKFLIFEGEKQADESVKAIDHPLASVTGLETSSFTSPTKDDNGKWITGGTASFTFTELKQPYVILLKARPNDDTLADYFSNNQTRTKTNELTLKTENWNTGVRDNQDVTIVSNILDKKASRLQAGVINWTVDYKPYDLDLQGSKIEDTLPLGIDLRLDANGKLILDGNIEANELVLQANGEYTLGNPVNLELGVNVSYDNSKRVLTFNIPNSKTAYRFSYITDITGVPGSQITNKVSLLGAKDKLEDAGDKFVISEQDGEASFQRNGWIRINKSGVKGVLAGAEFTLFAMDGTTVIKKGITDVNGELILKTIPNGQYILRETKAPANYAVEGVDHTVVVTKGEDGSITTSIDGKTEEGSNEITIQNFKAGTAGNLSIKKTVAGSGADENKLFTFRFSLESEAVGNSPAGPFTYIGHGVPGGKISIGGTVSLASDQSITIVGLPKEYKYTVTETDYAPEGYTVDKEQGTVIGTVVADKTELAHFTNTRTVGDLTIKKTVAGNAGDFKKKFDFTISLKWDYDGDVGDLNPSYTYIGQGVSDGTIKSGDTISLAHGESITIKDLPAGASYTVTEEDYSADGYYTVKTGAVGVIEADQTKSAVFTNIRNVFYPGNLTITKTVTGPGADTEKAFDFVVTFNGATGRYNYTGVGVAAGTIKSGDTISLAHGQSITITGLPEGSTYQVKEVEASAEGYTVTAVGDEGTILPNAEAVAAFTNEHTISKIDVIGKKIWVGGPAEKPTIELQLYRDGVKFGAAVSLKNGSASYTWTGLDETDANGKAYKYTVDEVAVPENYKKSVSADGLTVTNTYVDPDSKEDTGSQIPTEPDDESKPDLPHTGEGRSTSALGLALILAGLALGLFAWLQQRPRKKYRGQE